MTESERREWMRMSAEHGLEDGVTVALPEALARNSRFMELAAKELAERENRWRAAHPEAAEHLDKYGTLNGSKFDPRW